MLIFKTYKPKYLARFISGFDYYLQEAESDFINYALLPLGTVQLLFQFDTHVEHNTIFTKGWQNRPDIFVAGPYDKGYEMKLSPSAKIFSVTFKPSMFRYFTSYAISELKNQLLHPTQIWGKEANRLIERVTIAKNNYSRLAIIEEFLLKHFREINHSPIENAVFEVLTSKGMGRINNYARLSGLSIARFRKRFSEEVGLSPKEFQRLIRINTLSKFYSKNSKVKLTWLAHQFEYFDQSHFIKEFKFITGHTPYSYLKNKRFLQF